MNRMRIYGFVLVGIALLIVGGALFYNSKQRQIPVIFSNKELLSNTWENYRNVYLEQGTHRTLDKQRDFISTSEGESYTMLRAAWSDDKTTFDGSWHWTKDNLRRKDDTLSSWLFGKRSDGSYGIITEKGGQNTASDGDTDIALALLMADGRWHQQEYYGDARAVINDIWEKEVVMVAGKPVMTSNDLERNSKDTVVVNPSYFAPYAYRLFAKADPRHDWNGLASNSYAVLSAASKTRLNSNASVGLPPNWIVMNRNTGEIAASSNADLTTQYGYDAMRVPWRIAMDYSWNKDPHALAYLKSLSYLNDQWTTRGTLSSVYSHDGSIVSDNESPAMYGSSIGYFLIENPNAGKKIIEEKLQVLYSPDKGAWNTALSYYDDNWAWFGIALTSGQLPNITNL